MQNHPRPRHVDPFHTGASFLSVHDFGAVGNGVADDTAALQAGIDAAGVSGRILILPTGIYRLTTTLRQPYSNVTIIGEATTSLFQAETPARGTVLTWAGATDGVMLDFGPASPGPPYVIAGTTLENVTFDAGTAGYPLLVSSVLNAVFRNIVIKGGRINGLTVTVRFPIAVGFSVVAHPEFSNVSVIVTGNATGIVLDGYALGGYGTAFCHFTNCSVVHEHGPAYVINYGDDNYFYNCSASRITGGTGHAIFLAGSNDATLRAARSNVFLGFNGQGEIRAQGLAGWTNPSVGNFILLTSMDTPPVMTIDAGASLYYLDTGGYTPGSNARMRLPGFETAELNPVLPQQRTALKVVGNSNNGNPFISVVGGTAGTLPQFSVPPQLPAFTVAGLTTLAAALGLGNAGALAYGTNTAGGAETVQWDGTVWRRLSDRTAAHALPGASSRISLAAFLAPGDDLGTVDVSAKLQAACDFAIANKVALDIPPAAVGYRLDTPINLTDVDGWLTMTGAGQIAPAFNAALVAPVGGSLFLGNTGTGQAVFDCLGSNNILFQGINISSLGQSTPSTMGIVFGTSTTSPFLQTPAGANCSLENVAIWLPYNVASVPLYFVGGAGLSHYLNLWTLGDYGIVISRDDDFAFASPYATVGAAIGVDGMHFQGCNVLTYGTGAGLYIQGSHNMRFDQLYVATIFGGPAYVGTPYAVFLRETTDIKIDIECDYYPSVLLTEGAITNVYLQGSTFPNVTPTPAEVPLIAFFSHGGIRQVTVQIEPVMSARTNYHFSSNGTTANLLGLNSCHFSFNTLVSPNVAFFNTTAVSAKPFFNLHFDGTSDSGTYTFRINGAVAGAGTMRYWNNGVLVGTG